MAFDPLSLMVMIALGYSGIILLMLYFNREKFKFDSGWSYMVLNWALVNIVLFIMMLGRGF